MRAPCKGVLWAFLTSNMLKILLPFSEGLPFGDIEKFVKKTLVLKNIDRWDPLVSSGLQMHENVRQC